MNKKSTTIRLLLISLFFVLLNVSCRNPLHSVPDLEADRDEVSYESLGTIEIYFSDISSRTIIPDMDLTIDYYKLSGTGPSGATVGPFSVSGASYTIPGLAVGLWTISADAYNASGFKIGSGQGSGLVVSGGETSITVPVSSLSGSGGLDITILWPEGTLYSPTVSSILTLPDGSADAVSFTQTENSVFYQNETVTAGYIILNTTVKEGAFSQTFFESIKVVSGYTTTVVLEITQSMFLDDAVGTPEADPPAGSYNGSQTISLSCYHDNADIYYTLNGSTPNEERGTEYTGPFTINTSAVMQTSAVSPAGIHSEILTAEYIIEGTIQRPVVDVSAGLYYEPVTVSLSSPGEVTIVYTTDDTTPAPLGAGSYYTGPITISADTILKAIAFESADSSNISDVMTASYRITDYVEDPVFSLGEGTFNQDQTLSITCGTTGSVIYYTTDGTDPTAVAGTEYTAPINIDQTMKVKAIGTKSDWGNSGTVSAEYTMTVADPVATVAGGTYYDTFSVELSTVTGGASIYYTIDGSTPDETSELYSEAIAVDISTELKAIAIRDGWTDSSVVTEDYELKVTTPVLSIGGGSYMENGFEVSFTAVTDESSVVYTVDESTPVSGSNGSFGTSRLITSDTTLKVVGAKSGWTDSDVITAVYDVGAAVVTTPADVVTTIDTTPEFSWNGAYETYEIVIATDDPFSNVVESSTTASPEGYMVITPLSSNQTYYWHVREKISDTAWGDWNTEWEFTLADSVMFSGIIPTDGGTAANQQPILDWDEVAGAVSYSIKYAGTEAGLAGATAVTGLTESEYPYPTELAYDEEVWWQVTAVNDTDDEFISSNYSFVAPPLVTMVTITGGTFTMGDTWGDGGSDELPTHSVTVSDFYLAETEVTYETWDEVYDWAVSNGYTFANVGRAGDDGTSGGDTVDEPVTYINWRDMMVWCNAASEYDDKTPVYTYSGSVIRNSSDSNSTACDNAICDWTATGYRLPTEAEWEYAAKGGDSDTDSGEYAGSSTIGDVAWYSGNSGSDTKTVGTKQANELGLYDMSGNVYEWCWDWYGSYTSDAETDPTGPSSGSSRVRRGGYCSYSEHYCRVADRINSSPYYGYYDIGFRVALSSVP